MDTYECESCSEIIEIEKYEAVFGNNEPYEHGLCQDCFDKED